MLEQFAELYLKSEGAVLERMMSVPPTAGTTHAVPTTSSATPNGDAVADLLERMERVEADDREFVSAFEILIHRVEALESKIGGAGDEPKHPPRKK